MTSRRGDPWNDDEALRALLAAGVPFKRIARQLGRSQEAVARKLRQGLRASRKSDYMRLKARWYALLSVLCLLLLSGTLVWGALVPSEAPDPMSAAVQLCPSGTACFPANGQETSASNEDGGAAAERKSDVEVLLILISAVAAVVSAIATLVMRGMAWWTDRADTSDDEELARKVRLRRGKAVP